jgi:hypothetical protein
VTCDTITLLPLIFSSDVRDGVFRISHLLLFSDIAPPQGTPFISTPRSGSSLISVLQ